jgi:hypothetical protein
MDHFSLVRSYQRGSSPGENKGCHIVALPLTLKGIYSKAKEELWKLKYFTMLKHSLQKIL